MNSQDLSAGDVPRALLRRRELCKLLGVGAATIYRWLRNGSFPPPVRLGPRRVAWRVEDVEEWLANRPPTQRKVV